MVRQGLNLRRFDVLRLGDLLRRRYGSLLILYLSINSP